LLVIVTGFVLSGCEPANHDAPSAVVPAAPSAAAAATPVAQRVLNASPYQIAADTELAQFVETTGAAAVEMHCVECHGADLTGKPGVPNLVDYDWLWGITFEETNDVGPVMEIQQTLLYGVRNTDCPEIEAQSYYGGCADTRYSEMPGYQAIGTFNEQQVGDLTEWTLSLSGADADAAAVERAQPLTAVCAECHGPTSEGYKPYGGPNLTDDISLYGNDRATIRDVIANGRLGKCPPWGRTLDAATVKALAVYLWRKATG
jgi:cytochrome c oxidase cbb3-type subunit 3